MVSVVCVRGGTLVSLIPKSVHHVAIASMHMRALLLQVGKGLVHFLLQLVFGLTIESLFSLWTAVEWDSSQPSLLLLSCMGSRPQRLGQRVS